MTLPATVAAAAELRRRYPALFRAPLQARLQRWLVWGGLTAFTLYAMAELGFFDFEMIANGVGKLGFMLNLMWPPAHNGWLGDFLEGIAETLAMAFLGTLLAVVMSLPLALLGAKNVVTNLLTHFTLRRLFDGIRGVDQLIWALVFVNVVGLGPFAGILAIAVADTGTFAKLFAEAIENSDKRQIEGVRASGGSKLAEIRFAILPQVLPVLISQTLYFFESNTRSATILGIVGAGGIGLHLSDRIRVNNWDEAAFIILMILVTVSIIDFLSRLLRHRLIGAH